VVEQAHWSLPAIEYRAGWKPVCAGHRRSSWNGNQSIAVDGEPYPAEFRWNDFDRTDGITV
jgi:hypothetical protein